MGPGQRGEWLQTGAATSRMRRTVGDREPAGSRRRRRRCGGRHRCPLGSVVLDGTCGGLAGTPPLVVREWVVGSCVSESLVPAKNSQLQGWNPWLLYV